MKQSFLDSLKSAPIDTASAMVKSAGYTAYVVPESIMAITAEAKPKTVVLWEKNGLVNLATAGDPVEIEYP